MAEVPHPGARRIYESGQASRVWEQSQSGHAPSAPTVPYLKDNHCALPATGSKKFSSVKGTAVRVDFHETGRSGFTAYWKHTEASWAQAFWRRRMGSVDGWPLASPDTEQRGATTVDGRRNG